MQRRERTHHLIELGGLVTKAGLVDLTGDDRSALLGGLLELADQLQDAHRADVLARWRHRGRHVFEADAQSNLAKREAER